MKLKKFILFIFIFFFGIICGKALPQNETQISNGLEDYYNYEYCYRVLATLTYYDDYSAAAKFTKGDKTLDQELEVILTTAIEKFKPFYKNSNENSFALPTNEIKEKIKEIYNQGTTQDLARDMLDSLKNSGVLIFTGGIVTIENDYLNNLAKQTSLTGMLEYTLSVMNGIIDNSGVYDELKTNHESLKATTVTGFENFCNYLSTHKGIAYYIQTALKIISYVAIGLAIILGGLDFAEAILSNEDNALAKAFQKFIRRLVAAVLVFLAYLIVQLFIGLITDLPGLDLDAGYTQICDELKLGSLKN